MRVRVRQKGLIAYPDVVALCEETEFDDSHLDTLLNPTLIVEVFKFFDRASKHGEHFVHYRSLPSFQECVLIAQDIVCVEHYTRQANGQWLLTELQSLDDVRHLASIGCSLALRDVYDKVEMEHIERG